MVAEFWVVVTQGEAKAPKYAEREHVGTAVERQAQSCP